MNEEKNVDARSVQSGRSTSDQRDGVKAGSGHTKGPWRKGSGDWPRHDGGVTACVYEEATCLPVALAWSTGDEWSRPAAENTANAHLIAVAPEYHEEAIELVERHDAKARAANFNRCGCGDCGPFRLLIAKAAGR